MHCVRSKILVQGEMFSYKGSIIFTELLSKYKLVLNCHEILSQHMTNFWPIRFYFNNL